MKPTIRVLALSLLVLGLSLALEAPAAAAITINVNALTKVSGDNHCSFEEALSALDTQHAFDGCPFTGTGAVTIVIPSSVGANVASGVNIPIRRSVTITGATTATTAVQFAGGSNGDRALVVSGGSGVTVTIKNLTLRGTNANLLSGLFNTNSTVTFSAVRVTGFGYAGLVNNANATMNVNACDIDGNGIFGSLPLGGGILNSGGTLFVDASNISGNFAYQGGGIFNGIRSSGGTNLTVTNSTLSNNQAIDNGGGLYSAGQEDLRNSTFSNNSASSGGGIYHANSQSEFNLQHCTIAQNYGEQGGGGMDITNLGTHIITRNLIGDNTSGDDPDPNAPQPFRDVLYVNDCSSLGSLGTYNLVAHVEGIDHCFATDDGSGNKNGSPLIDALQNMGGRTLVHPLKSGSPALDGIPTSAGDIGFHRDQRGDSYVRPINSPDMGAFEQNPTQWEAETLTVASKSSATYVVVNDAAASAGKNGNLQATNNTNQFVTYRTPTLATGTYNVVVRFKKGPNAGTFQVLASETLNGTYISYGPVQDAYAPTATWGEANLGFISMFNTSQKYFRFKVVSKNSASTSYQIFPDFIMLHP